MDFPYYVERVKLRNGQHTEVSEWSVSRSSHEVLCSTPDVNAAYKIVDALNAEYEREKKGSA